MKLALVLLLALALVAGILFVVKPWGGEIELTYALQFPPGFAGDRKGAAEETLGNLRRRMVGSEPVVWGGRAFPDGRIRLRFKGLKPEDLAAARRIIEKPARLEIRAKGKMVLETRDVISAQHMLSFGEGPPGIIVHLSPEAAKKVDSIEDALLMVFLDGEALGPAGYHSGPSGDALTFTGPPDDQVANEWGLALRGGAHAFPLGEPQVGRYRGELKP